MNGKIEFKEARNNRKDIYFDSVKIGYFHMDDKTKAWDITIWDTCPSGVRLNITVSDYHTAVQKIREHLEIKKEIKGMKKVLAKSIQIRHDENLDSAYETLKKEGYVRTRIQKTDKDGIFLLIGEKDVLLKDEINKLPTRDLDRSPNYMGGIDYGHPYNIGFPVYIRPQPEEYIKKSDVLKLLEGFDK